MKTKSKVESPINAEALKEPEAECGNCDWRGPASDTKEIRDYWQRVEPGDTCPQGECPECGALAHLIEKPAPPQPVQAATREHTPLPWRTEDGQIFGPNPEFDQTGEEILIVDAAPENSALTEYDEANCKLICRAVNSHAELLDACKSVVAFIESCKSSGLKPNPDYSQFATELYTLRAAIARAEGGAS